MTSDLGAQTQSAASALRVRPGIPVRGKVTRANGTCLSVRAACAGIEQQRSSQSDHSASISNHCISDRMTRRVIAGVTGQLRGGKLG